MPTRVLDLDLVNGLHDRNDLAGYERALVIARWSRAVLGTVTVPVRDGRLLAADVAQAVEDDRVLSQRRVRVAFEQAMAPADPNSPLPRFSVVIPTHDRPRSLRACLDSLFAFLPPGSDVIVVDSAPSDDSARELTSEYPVQYVREERPGPGKARSLGARLGTGDIIVFVDDDVVCDTDLITALLAPFSDRRVGAVTGLIMPLELENEAQESFELHAGPSLRGFEPRQFDFTTFPASCAGSFGAGANMAVRRWLLESLQPMDVDLERRGKGMLGGEDTHTLYSVFEAGYLVVYEPNAIVWHRHYADPEALRRTLTMWHGHGAFAMFTRWTVENRDLQALKVGMAWFFRHHLRELVRSLFRRPNHSPLRLVIAEIAGALRGPFAYISTRRSRGASQQA